MEKPTHFHTISTDLEKKIDTYIYVSCLFPVQKDLNVSISGEFEVEVT